MRILKLRLRLQLEVITHNKELLIRFNSLLLHNSNRVKKNAEISILFQETTVSLKPRSNKMQQV